MKCKCGHADGIHDFSERICCLMYDCKCKQFTPSEEVQKDVFALQMEDLQNKGCERHGEVPLPSCHSCSPQEEIHNGVCGISCETCNENNSPQMSGGDGNIPLGSSRRTGVQLPSEDKEPETDEVAYSYGENLASGSPNHTPKTEGGSRISESVANSSKSAEGSDFKLSDEYFINFCRRDQIWLVCRQTSRDKKFYITVAECFTEEAALILWKELSK